MTIASTQAAILGLLHDGPKTGGDLNAIAQKWLSPYWNMTRSQVYRELPALADRGLVKPAKEYGPRLSLQYKITGAGKRAFQAWLREDPSTDLLRNEIALRIAFGALQESEQVETLMDEMIERHMKARDAIHDLIKEADNDGNHYDVQALHFALMYHQMVLTWLESVELP